MEDHNPGCRLFLIGSEASTAMSPELWSPVFEHLGVGWSYEAWDVPGGAPMSDVRARLLDADVVAANITMPHKHWAALTADIVSEPVRLSGASNLLVRHDGRLAAHNTDIMAVTELLGDRYERHALMLGAGGAARAALVALKGRIGRVTITDRDPHASQQLLVLAETLGMDAKATEWADAQVEAPQASLIVNATPLGKNSQHDPAWGQSRLADDAFVYDFVYARHVTASIARAKEQGLQCADGWDHLREQAAAMVPILGLASQAGALLERTLTQIRAQS